MSQPQEQLVVRIASDGSVVAETRGIEGPKCLDYINLLEDLLEAQTTSSEFTDEYHQTATKNHYEVSNVLPQQ